MNKSLVADPRPGQIEAEQARKIAHVGETGIGHSCPAQIDALQRIGRQSGKRRKVGCALDRYIQANLLSCRNGNSPPRLADMTPTFERDVAKIAGAEVAEG